MQYSIPAFTQYYLRTIFALVVIALAISGGGAVYGQAIDRITADANPADLVALPNHHPQWANKENDAGLLPSDLTVDQLTLVLSRSPQQEESLQEFLGEQQNLASPNYHHWLTPVEMGERFGLSTHDIATLTLWLQSQGLHVNWVSPSRTFIGFGGTAGALGRAFHTQLRTYHTNDAERRAPASDLMIPRTLAPAVKAIHGLYTVEDQPLHSFRSMQSISPDLSTTTGDHFITPGDFAAIYGEGSTSGVTIGIVGRSRTDFSDFENFRQLTETNFPNPTEVVPTAFGGVDPGPAYTAPPATNVSLDDQSEATLDVTRAGSVAGSAQILLVVATSASGGVEADAQYLVETTPVPASVMSISFGACESSVGPAGVAFWDTLFQQAAGEGISVLVSSGDSGASGCDEAFSTPPTSPLANSPNYICSSSYATCVGGTEFNDTTVPSEYWSEDNSRNLASALGYIPEGGWNEPLNSSGGAQVAASGGGVSSVIATPTWQTGSGVPAARSGRYTPDIAFSASSHDGYFGCFAAGGGDCVAASNGSFNFAVFAGTSAAAPSMAGIAAVLDGEQQASEGNLNPQLYQMAATAPTVFHDVTVASSGVTNCALATPSLCNNSIPGPSGLSGGQAGFLLTAGYDQVTGLGSLNIPNFLNNFQGPPAIKLLTPSLTFSSQLVGFPSPGEVDFENSGSAPLDPLAITISGANANDFIAVNNCESALGPGLTCPVQITFTPSAAGTRTATMTVTSANAINSPRVVPLSGTGTTTLYSPDVAVDSAGTITIAQSLTVTVWVSEPPGAPRAPTGSVTLTRGSYHSAPVTLTGGSVTIDIPAGALALGQYALTGNYTPDSTSASIYSSASATDFITVTPVPIPSFDMAGVPLMFPPGATTGNTSLIAISPTGGFTGNITLSAVVTSAPPGAQDPPTFSFGATSPVNVAGITSVSATLTVLTTAASNNALPRPANRISWYTSGAASLACILLMSMPRRLRRWRAMVGSVLLLISLGGGLLACGGGGSGGGKSAGTGATTPSDPGTTPGQYMVTITGTAPGATTATCMIGVNID